MKTNTNAMTNTDAMTNAQAAIETMVNYEPMMLSKYLLQKKIEIIETKISEYERDIHILNNQINNTNDIINLLKIFERDNVNIEMIKEIFPELCISTLEETIDYLMTESIDFGKERTMLTYKLGEYKKLYGIINRRIAKWDEEE